MKDYIRMGEAHTFFVQKYMHLVKQQCSRCIVVKILGMVNMNDVSVVSQENIALKHYIILLKSFKHVTLLFQYDMPIIYFIYLFIFKQIYKEEKNCRLKQQ